MFSSAVSACSHEEEGTWKYQTKIHWYIFQVWSWSFPDCSW